MSLERLDELGVEYRTNKDGSIDRVRWPLTCNEWCETAMREGSYYVGGCCATCSAMQDEINAVFREGGWAGGHVFSRLAELAAHHEGFETFQDEQLSYQVDSLDQITDPIKRVGALWVLVKPHLQISMYELPRTNRPLGP